MNTGTKSGQIPRAKRGRRKRRLVHPHSEKTTYTGRITATRFTKYTPLNNDRGKIMDEALSVDLLLTPWKVLSLRDVDPSCKCRYHRNIKHTIEECQALKHKIEELIQVDHLRKYMEGDH